MGALFGSPIFIIAIVFMIAGLIVQWVIKRKFKKYSKTQLVSGLSGKEVAERMLLDNNIHDVKVISVKGKLTDHYNPVNKTINLSPDIYEGRNTASAAVAAHETGHAVQHATQYSMLNLRTALVPMQNASGKIINILFFIMIFGGMFLYNAFPFEMVLYILIGAYAVMTTFTLITLPVEFDASNRALVWIKSRGIVNEKEYIESKDALKWAATTYVIAALGTLATLLYYVALARR